MSDLTLNIVGGAIGGIISGLLIYLVQAIHDVRKRKMADRDNRTIKALSSRKIIKDDILYSLRPGVNIEFMRQLLGAPTKHSNQDNPLFAEESTGITNSYLYILNNAYLKITSKDNVSIDSITIFPTDEQFRVHEWEYLCEEKETRLNRITVGEKLIEIANSHTFISTMKDNVFAIETYIPNPYYNSYTFFGHAYRGHEYVDTNDINLLKGGTITGICIASDHDTAHYIYEYEKMAM